MPFIAYVIYSDFHKRFYKGHCEDLEKRIEEHNSGQTKSIKAFIPFRLVYFEVFETRKEALVRERYFKTATERRYLKSKINQEIIE